MLRKLNVGSLVMDLAILAAAVYTGHYWILLLLVMTGGYTHD